MSKPSYTYGHTLRHVKSLFLWLSFIKAPYQRVGTEHILGVIRRDSFVVIVMLALTLLSVLVTIFQLYKANFCCS